MNINSIYLIFFTLCYVVICGLSIIIFHICIYKPAKYCLLPILKKMFKDKKTRRGFKRG